VGKACFEDLVLVGKVIRPHGLKGLVTIESYAESKETFLNAGEVFLAGTSGETEKHGVISVTPGKKFFLLKLKGVDSREQAEAYRGGNIHIQRRRLSRQSDEYFWFELIGLSVYLDTGRRVGTVRHILQASGHDIYVVHEGEKEILIPAVREVIKEVDLDNKKIVITGMEDLLDLNEV
jgi:16S rRNA processing protein RimM